MTSRTYLVIKSDGPEIFPSAAAAEARAIEWVTNHPSEIATLAETTAEVYIPPQTPVITPVDAPPQV